MHGMIHPVSRALHEQDGRGNVRAILTKRSACSAATASGSKAICTKPTPSSATGSVVRSWFTTACRSAARTGEETVLPVR